MFTISNRSDRQRIAHCSDRGQKARREALRQGGRRPLPAQKSPPVIYEDKKSSRPNPQFTKRDRLTF